jgi:hypothetical protein
LTSLFRGAPARLDSTTTSGRWSRANSWIVSKPILSVPDVCDQIGRRHLSLELQAEPLDESKRCQHPDPLELGRWATPEEFTAPLDEFELVSIDRLHRVRGLERHERDDAPAAFAITAGRGCDPPGRDGAERVDKRGSIRKCH